MRGHERAVLAQARSFRPQGTPGACGFTCQEGQQLVASGQQEVQVCGSRCKQLLGRIYVTVRQRASAQPLLCAGSLFTDSLGQGKGTLLKRCRMR